MKNSFFTQAYLLSLWAVFAIFSITACHPTATENTMNVPPNATHTPHNADGKTPNKLINESSPYLLMHAYNPVNWHPWGEEALKKAKAENKMLIVSIGYAACHWCHVMEKESFEDSTVAALMNKHFIPIKIDREERPDVDQVYMDAIHVMGQRGGWPLNAIALPDGRPVYAGTYYPKEQWLSVLSQLHEAFTQRHAEVVQQAEAVTQGVQQNDLVQLNTDTPNFTQQHLHNWWANQKGYVDVEKGGQQRAPKFPLPVGWQSLLAYYYHTQNPEVLNAVTTTLNRMAWGGIYDQIGGGFARYSVDDEWKVPHFEKMLYDNGQLVSLYAQAYQATNNPLYRRTIEQTLTFVARELTHPQGGFYASLDADSEGEEGKFYVWTYADLEQTLGTENTPLIARYYTATAGNGNWEHGKNVLHRNRSDAAFAKAENISLADLQSRVQAANKKLLNKRNERVRPPLDDKVITAWNALMLQGYIDAYNALGNAAYLETAQQSASFLVENLMQADGRLNRNYKNGKATINAFLDDYALLIKALTSLYQATFNEQWLQHAQQLTDYTLQHFYNAESGMFYYTSNTDPALITRTTELRDNVMPASNSVMAANLHLLGQLLYQSDYTNKAKTILNNVIEELPLGGPYYAQYAATLMHLVYPNYEMAIMGQKALAYRKILAQEYLPNITYLGSTQPSQMPLLQHKFVDSETRLYLCQNKSCQQPVNTPQKALTQIKKLQSDNTKN